MRHGRAGGEPGARQRLRGVAAATAVEVSGGRVAVVADPRIVERRVQRLEWHRNRHRRVDHAPGALALGVLEGRLGGELIAPRAGTGWNRDAPRRLCGLATVDGGER